MINDLLSTIKSHGDRGAVVPFSRIDDLREELTALKNGAFHPSWVDRMANHITNAENKFLPSGLNFTPRSVITIVMPSPKVLLRFHVRGEEVPVVVPPHFTHWCEKNERALQYLKDFLAPHGFSAAMAITLPKKLLAVHSGLARYGRNNISYHDEFGSYTQIMNYLSDMPCDDAPWFPIRRMETCEHCRACVTACPTGAIDADRPLIDSDRCLTLFNESARDVFPEWISKDAHNSIVGCTKCQDCCPGNAHNQNNTVMGVTFTEEETTELLQHKKGAPYSDALAAKIEATDIFQNDQIHFLPRNLAALLQR